LKIVAFYLKQIIGLGTLGFLVWLCVGWWRFGLIWSTDMFSVWFIALALAGYFVVLICTPIQLAVRRIKTDWLAYVLGILSGPIGVCTYLLINRRLEPSVDSYINRYLLMHSVFALLGLLFSIFYRRRFGPNNSFKPSPLRGLGRAP